MQANAKPTDAARNGAPDAEEPAPTKMDDQHYKLGPAMPVRTSKAATRSPYGQRAVRNRAQSSRGPQPPCKETCTASFPALLA